MGPGKPGPFFLQNCRVSWLHKRAVVHRVVCQPSGFHQVSETLTRHRQQVALAEASRSTPFHRQLSFFDGVHATQKQSWLSRTSPLTGGRPCRTFQVQNQRPPTMSGHNRFRLNEEKPRAPTAPETDRETQKRRSIEVHFVRLFTERCSTPMWWSRAKFSI